MRLQPVNLFGTKKQSGIGNIWFSVPELIGLTPLTASSAFTINGENLPLNGTVQVTCSNNLEITDFLAGYPPTWSSSLTIPYQGYNLATAPQVGSKCFQVRLKNVQYGYYNESLTCTVGNISSVLNCSGYNLTLDSDALSFINGAGITNSQQMSAIDYLVVNLKSAGIWTKLKACYPFVGGTSARHSYNLKNVAQYQLYFGGGWTHVNTGIRGNGVNTYADTGLYDIAMGQNSIHYSLNARNTGANPLGFDMGAYKIVDFPSYMIISYGNTNIITRLNQYVDDMAANTDTHGFYTISRTGANTSATFKNGTKIINSTYASVVPNNTFTTYIGAVHYSGGSLYSTYKEYNFASIGDGLTDTECQDLNTIVINYNNILSR